MHALVCPSFTRAYGAELARDVLGLSEADAHATVARYPGLDGADGTFTLAAAEEAIVAAADAVPRDAPVVGFGYSLGAALLLGAVARDRVAVDALVLVAPVASFHRRAEEAGRLFRPWWQDMADLHGFDANRVLKELRERPEDEEPLALAPRVDVPSLVLHGGRDVDVPVAHGEDLAAALPLGSCTVVPQEEHSWRKGRRVAATAVMMFLAGLDGPGGPGGSDETEASDGSEAD